MTADTATRHFLGPGLATRAIRILLVGCGGNGAQMAMGLASLDGALRAISPRSLAVTIVDDDVVTEANLGRQPFYRCDIGHSKARTLVERINLAHGLVWSAVHGRAPEAIGLDNVDPPLRPAGPGFDRPCRRFHQSREWAKRADPVARTNPAVACGLRRSGERREGRGWRIGRDRPSGRIRRSP
jgi:hypothetical protein